MDLFPLHYLKYILERGFQFTRVMLLALVTTLSEEELRQDRIAAMLVILRNQALTATTLEPKELLPLGLWLSLATRYELRTDLNKMKQEKWHNVA